MSKKKRLVNRKVRNATRIKADGLEFRSKLEFNCYKVLKESGLSFKYEDTRFCLLDGFRPDKAKVIGPMKKTERITQYKQPISERLMVDNSIIRAITYTPDFILEHEDTIYIIESKGFANDTYPMKKKLMIALLESSDKNYVFAEIKSMAQMKQLVDYIKGNKDGREI